MTNGNEKAAWASGSDVGITRSLRRPTSSILNVN